MYRVPVPDIKILRTYYTTYFPILQKAINDFIVRNPIHKIRMGHTSVPAHYFECGLSIGSQAYKWVKGLLKEEKLEQLLIGDWNAIKSLTDEIEAIQPDFRESLSMTKYKIKEATKDRSVEDLNYILKKIFVDGLYEHDLDKSEVVRMKGLRVCPYCGSDILKNLRNHKGQFIKSQLDHYLPKSKYPFLSLNFYNLFPVCKDCNMVDTGKGEKSPISDDFNSFYLPYPYIFDSTSFNFTCSYDGGDIYDELRYHIDIDYHGNHDLRKGYNDIIPIHPFYQGMRQIPVKIMTSIYANEQEYIELTSKITGLEKPLFRPNIMSICGFPDTNQAACRYEKHKFHIDIFNSLIRYI